MMQAYEQASVNQRTSRTRNPSTVEADAKSRESAMAQNRRMWLVPGQSYAGLLGNVLASWLGRTHENVCEDGSQMRMIAVWAVV